ncbi:MAG: hypothetical protein O7F74_09650 [Bacteroidetes bacterium]|nr:hypothetical protein [Bacteroidota bacterium]
MSNISFRISVMFLYGLVQKIIGRGVIIGCLICLAFNFSSLAQQKVHSKKLETVRSKNAGFLGKKRKTKKAQSSPTGKEGDRFKKWKKDFNPSRYAELEGANYSGGIKGKPFKNARAYKYIKKQPQSVEGGRFRKWRKDFNPSRYAELGAAQYSGNIKGKPFKNARAYKYIRKHPKQVEGGRWKGWKKDFNPSRYAELGGALYAGNIKGTPPKNKMAGRFIRKHPKRVEGGRWKGWQKDFNPSRYAELGGALYSGGIAGKPSYMAKRKADLNYSGYLTRQKISKKNLARTRINYPGYLTRQKVSKKNLARTGINYSGYLTATKRQRRSPSKEINYSGYLTSNLRQVPQQYKEIRAYQGNLVGRKKVNKSVGADYQGDIVLRKFGFGGITRAQYMAKKNKDIPKFNGKVKFKQPKTNTKLDGIFIVVKNPTSMKQKETIRKRSLFLSKIFRNREQPPDFKKKIRRPKYDRKEKEIWYE